MPLSKAINSLIDNSNIKNLSNFIMQWQLVLLVVKNDKDKISEYQPSHIQLDLTLLNTYIFMYLHG